MDIMADMAVMDHSVTEVMDHLDTGVMDHLDTAVMDHLDMVDTVATSMVKVRFKFSVKSTPINNVTSKRSGNSIG